MAAGDVLVFNRAKEWLADGTIDLDTHTFIVRLVDNTPTPTVGAAEAATPNLPLATDYPAVTGGAYADITLTGVTWAESSGTVTFDANDVSWSQDVSGPTNIAYAIIYDDTAASDNCLAFVDLTQDGGTTPISLQAGDISITWNANGIFTLA